jgi:predicted transcriptional regulator
MTEPAVCFEENDSFLDVCYRLRDCPIHSVPVIADAKVTGIISRAIVLKCILQRSEQTSGAGKCILDT